MNKVHSQLLLGALFAIGLANTAAAQIITSTAGNVSVSDALRARETPLVIPRSVAADQDGFIYMGDDGSRTVRRIDPATGIANIFAGGGMVVDDLIPVRARSAYLNNPVGLAIGPGRNLYIADDANHRVRLLTPSGLLTTVAGNGICDFFGDGGPATSAGLCTPTGVALDSAGNLYIADRENRAIRKVSFAGVLLGDQVIVPGVITTLAGGFNATRTGDGIPALEARLSAPWGITVDANGNVFFTDDEDHVVRKIEASTGLIRTVAGRVGLLGITGDGGPATEARLWGPRGVAVAPNGDLYIGQIGAVRKVAAATGIITTIAGRGIYTLADGRPGVEVWIPDGVGQIFLTRSNILLMVLEGDNLIARLDLNTGIFSIVAGDPQRVGDGGPAATAAVAQPQKLALDTAGNLYFTDTFHHRVRRISPGPGGPGTGTVTTVAGTGVAGISGDGGPALQATLNFPWGVFVAPGSILYIADNFARVRRVGPDGVIQTVVGTNTEGIGGDGGPATSAQVSDPRAVVRDSAGNLYIADTGNHRVRRVDSSGVIRTFAGTGERGYSGDGGPAGAARLHTPSDLLLDGRGGLLIADFGNHRVRRIDLSTGIITTFAGDGSFTYKGDGGPATAAGLRQPRGLALDAQGNIYVAGWNSIRRIDAATRIITTVAGDDYSPGFTGDGGLATLARLSGTQGIVVDGSGNILFSDAVNNRIRRVSALAVVPVLAVSPTALTFSALEGGRSPTEQSVQISTANLARGSWTASARMDRGSGWLTIGTASGVTPGVLQAAVNSQGLVAGSYTGSVTINAPTAANSPQTVSITLTVTPGGNPRLAVDRQFLTFRTSEGGTSPSAQTVELTNAGGGVLRWSSRLQTSSGGNWLTISPSAGTGAATLILSASLGSLPVGVYQGLVLLTNLSTGESEALVVAFIVDRPVATLVLSQTTLLFTVNEGGSFIPPQTMQVINAGQGRMTWQILAAPLSGGDWLKIAETTGSSGAGAGTAVNLSPSPAGLGAGVYDTLVVVSAPGATNSPQMLLARLNVHPSGRPPEGNIRPGGLVLVGSAGGGIRQDSLAISTSGGSALSYVTSASTSSGGPWLSVSPPGGTLQGSSDRATIQVQANLAQLTAGVYRGKVTVGFSTGVTQDVGVLLVATPPGTAVAGVRDEALAEAPAQASADCTPQYQFPLHTGLVNNFSLPSGWSTPVFVTVRDNCGNPVNHAVVVCTFSNGDPALVLDRVVSVPGLYSGMWNPGREGSVSINVRAEAAGLQPEPTEPIKVTVGAPGSAPSATPSISRHGAVDAAAFKGFAPLAPGQIISVFGKNLGGDPRGATDIPLPRSLAGVTAKLAGIDLPLYFTAAGQLNAQVPFELAPGNTVPLVVTLAGKASPPEMVTLAKVQPGIFAVNSTGRGPGVITNASGALIDGSNPARRGDVVVVYATGLGATSPQVRSGEASPREPLARVADSITAYLAQSDSDAGVLASVEFAGLTPDLVGLYQVNLRIPEDAPLGEAVQLYLVQNQISSNRVTLVIR